MAIIMALLSMLLMAALGAALVLTTSSEALIAANFRFAQEGVYAADAALGRTIDDLAGNPQWTPILDGSILSTFVDGPPSGVRMLADGALLDLGQTVNKLNCRKPTSCSASNLAAITAERPWGANNPAWRLFAYGPLSNLLGAPAIVSSFYVIVMVADDALENDADPLRDGHTATNPGTGVLALRAEAFGPRGTHQIVEMTVAHTGAPAVAATPARIQVLSWRLVR